jgi:hypothetical protein
MKLRTGILLFVVSATAFADDPAPQGEMPSAEAPSAKGATYSGGDGSSTEKAVIVLAPNSSVGVRAEYEWIGRRLPDAQVKESNLLVGDGKYYDSVTVQTPDGKERTFYFDITSFVNNNLK